ncbi:MAG: sulfotransferase domain-containing protein [Verrucomicrobiota bacterium]|nr:sulfotransferase domain-containing protein [Verrucomicrobiota bacterium]
MYGVNRAATGIPWRLNFSSRAAELSGADAIVVSIPKSGRTWLRTFFAAYFCARYEHPFSLDPAKYNDPRVRRIIYSHDLFEHRTKGRWWDRIRGKYLVPPAELRRAHVLFLVRDPRDAFVSHYVQLTRPSADAPNELKRTTASDMLRDPLLGVRQIVETMNDWLKELGDRPNVTLMRYEDLQSAPAENFRRALSAIGERDISEPHLDHALRFSQFGNMKKLEAAGAFDSKILRARDQSDPEAANVRRGKIGGYIDYLSPEDCAYASEVMRELHPHFGYTDAAPASEDG